MNQKNFSMWQFPCLQWRKRRGAKTLEAQIAGRRDQTEDLKLKVTFRPLAKPSGKTRQLSWWSRQKETFTWKQPDNSKWKEFLVVDFCWIELIMARVYFLNVTFGIAIGKKSAEGPIRLWSPFACDECDGTHIPWGTKSRPNRKARKELSTLESRRPEEYKMMSFLFVCFRRLNNAS